MKHQNGFTFTELLIVVGIIGILLAAYMEIRASHEARDAREKDNCELTARERGTSVELIGKNQYGIRITETYTCPVNERVRIVTRHE